MYWITSSLELTFICFGSHLFLYWKLNTSLLMLMYCKYAEHVKSEEQAFVLRYIVDWCLRSHAQLPISISPNFNDSFNKFFSSCDSSSLSTDKRPCHHRLFTTFSQKVMNFIIIDCHDTTNDLQSANTVQLLSSYFISSVVVAVAGSLVNQTKQVDYEI